ncbi:MAG TPA: Gfo/Idh/MocA family oxidoreductase [Gemmataceae bacterium]|nr:Gfo/Idh/MocA family oxidoreductase [Gemmataceae bacterium]
MHLGAAVVGTGFIAPVHVESLRRIDRPVIGILGSSPPKSRAVAQKLHISKAYDRYEDLLADPSVGVVHLASPNRLHAEQCRLALAAGKHVICEKPLGLTAAETAELVELARQAPRVAAVCYNVRFYPLCLEARQRIADGELGPIYHVTGSYVQDWLLHPVDFNWRVLAEEGGPLRAVADIGTHWMDLVAFVTGLEIDSVCADLRTVLPVRYRAKHPVETFQGKSEQPSQIQPVAINTEDYGSVLLRFRGGAAGGVTVSQVTAGRKNRIHWEIAGARGAMAWDSERPNELWLGHRDKPNEVLLRDPALLHAGVRPFANYPGGHNEGFPDTFKQLFRAVYDAIDAGDGNAPRPFATFVDGHREALLCEAILQSHRLRRWMDVPSAAGPPTP